MNNGMDPHNICQAVIVRRSNFGYFRWIFFDKITPQAQDNPAAKASDELKKLLVKFKGLIIIQIPIKHIPDATHWAEDNFSCRIGHAIIDTHKGIVKTKIAVLLAPPSIRAHKRKPVNPAVWNRPNTISLGASLIKIGFFNNRSSVNKITEPEKFLRNANSLGLEKSNAIFIKGIFEPHMIESKSRPDIANFSLFIK